MKFDKIIKEAGFESCKFPRCSNIDVTLFDENDDKCEDIHFTRHLFSENPKSKINFFNFLCFLENEPVTSMNIKMDEDFLIVFYQSPKAYPFRKSAPLDPIDYME